MAGTSPNLYSFPNTDALAQQLRAYVLRCQNSAINRHNAFRVAVSGGSLPTVLAKALLAPSNGSSEDTVRFDKWDVFFADERAVPLDHPDSNYRLLKDELLSKIPAEMGTPKVHHIDVDKLKDDDTQELADLYQEKLMHSFAAKDSVKLPVFDLILLGCGPDGHTCSLFPGHELLREKDAWVAAENNSPKPPPKRITLTLPVVTHAVNIAFVAHGEGKKEILKKVFDAEEGRELPSALVNQGAGEKVSWFTDHAAIDGVQYPRRGSLILTYHHKSTTGRTATSKTTPERDGDGDGSADADATASRSTSTSTTASADRRKSLLPQRSIPFRDRDGAAPVRQQQQQQQETRLQRGSRVLTKMPAAQKQEQQEEDGPSESGTSVAAPTLDTVANTRRRSLMRPSPLTTGTATGSGAGAGTGAGTGTGTGTNAGGRVATTPKSATFGAQGLSSSPRKRDGVSSMSPKKTDMPPPPRPNRSASMRQPLKAGAGAGGGPATPGSGIRHVRHRSVIVAPSSTQSQVAVSKRSESQSSGSTSTTTGLAAGTRASGQFTTYQQQFSPRKVVRPAALSGARASTEGEDSLIPATWPEIAALQTELLQLNLLHSSSLQRMAALEAESEEQLQTKYDAVAKTYRAIVGEEKKCQRLLNGQALNHWLENASEHGGRQNFAAQIQVFSQLVQEVCDLTDGLGGRYTMLVQEFEDWLRKTQAIESMRLHRQQGDPSHVVFIDPLDRVWKDEVHAMTMRLEQSSRQLQSLDIAGYEGSEQALADAALLRTAKGLDEMIASMVDELKTIRRIEAQIVRSERQWVSQLTTELAAATHPREARGPRAGMWRTALLRS
ncbi:hypothetical protein CNMCM5793_009495 [Aspergillus hiratsukae]|uniref:6-phosphogluconolactonase n=1 Tax=Aspergillus hiratsukae TaxID=1194566 RepID=A0A8H6PTT8_9EURO|nr:hypothetical protein CNMCM5793_009495 [Aspergillus hiratsukae]KAF7160616.1 hypothetical protein CNMCM6106_008038 [Aspergillus hiratsukae]